MDSTTPVRVGLVGSGQWARTMHAPMHTSGAETALSGVWSPHADRAAALAHEFGVPAFSSYEQLLDESEAVDFAVPPAAQAGLALEAVRAGRALLLEKPLAQSLDDAIELAAAIQSRGVVNIVNLTKRYHRRTRDFISQTSQIPGGIQALTGRYVHGGFLESGFINPAERAGWRDELGALYDLGPHLLDLAEAVAGQVLTVSATGDLTEIIWITTTHAGGATGNFIVSGRVATDHVLTDLDLYGSAGHAAFSTRGLELSEAVATFRAELASAVRHGTAVTVDAQRALAIQLVIDAAARSFREGRVIEVV